MGKREAPQYRSYMCPTFPLRLFLHVRLVSLLPGSHESNYRCIYRSIYASTLAYIVDANVGRSSSAVATNSCFRGVAAFAAAEAAVPLQVALGDGGMYSVWAGLLIIAEALILLVWWKGGSWREKAERKGDQSQT